jgi:hypothetical protein
MGKVRVICALFLLFGGELGLSALASSPRRVTAWQLVRTVDRALAGVTQAAGTAETGRGSGAVTSAPFWSALDGMRLRVSRIEAALARRDGELFLLVDQGSADLGALRVAWARAGVENGAVAEGLRIAAAAFRTLRANYGREGLRHRQGGGLSDAERRHFQRVQRAQRRFADSLEPLREGSRRRGDAAAVAELDRFRSEAQRIAWAPLELESYLNALIAGGEMRGEWEADAPYLREHAPGDLAAADEAVQDLYVESDIGHVFTADLGAAGALSHLDRETEIPADEEEAAAPGGVRVYRLAEEEEPPAAAEIAAPPGEIWAEEPGEDEPAEETEAGPAEDQPEAEEGILEEEDLEEPEGVAEEVEAVPPRDETAGKPETDPAAGKGVSPTENPKQAAPAGPKAPDPSPPLSRPVG